MWSIGLREESLAGVVDRVLALAAATTGRETVAVIVEIDGPPAVQAAVAAFSRLLSNVVCHSVSPLFRGRGSPVMFSASG